jgi:NADPH-dependent 2,4-dienoyl-CoA reductase/sulfur reductase-like enzyme
MRLVIVGGSDADIAAAVRARELAPEVDVVVLVADRFPNYSICGLPYLICREVADPDNLAHRTREELERTVSPYTGAEGMTIAITGPWGKGPL